MVTERNLDLGMGVACACGHLHYPGSTAYRMHIEQGRASLREPNTIDYRRGFRAGQQRAIDTAWGIAAAALPKGWLLFGVYRAGTTPVQIKSGWIAEAVGPWDRSHRSRPSIMGYGPEPTSALLALSVAFPAEPS